VRNGKVTRDDAYKYLKGRYGTSMPDAVFNQEWLKLDPSSKKARPRLASDAARRR